VIESFVYRSDSIRARELRIPLFSRAGHPQRAAPAAGTPGDVTTFSEPFRHEGRVEMKKYSVMKVGERH
jgi:hypothetical protein